MSPHALHATLTAMVNSSRPIVASKLASSFISNILGTHQITARIPLQPMDMIIRLYF